MWYIVRMNGSIPQDQSKVEQASQHLQSLITKEFPTSTYEVVFANSRHRDEDDEGSIIGCRFAENLRNTSSPVEILEHVLVTSENEKARGGSFIFTQRFALNWTHLLSGGNSNVENLIGRRAFTSEIIPSFDANSHIRSSHVHDEDNHTIKLLRVGLPFGVRSNPTPKGCPLVQHSTGATKRDEQGIYFITMARSVKRIEKILENQFNPVPNDNDHSFSRDKLLGGNNVKSDLGGFFYAPSLRELGCEDLLDEVQERRKKNISWEQFPGVDWKHLSRHYHLRSSNGLMFFNHKDYLYHMCTAIGEEREKLQPPTLRVLYLLERLFSKWDDTWFRTQLPISPSPLRKTLTDAFSTGRYDEELNSQDISRCAKINEIMNSPVIIRSAWACRLMIGYVAVDPILSGPSENGRGLDTSDIHPFDLLAGNMPSSALSEGHYAIDYTRDDDNDVERFQWYSLGLGVTSGVGHVVPTYEKLLEKGINGMIEFVQEQAKIDRVKNPIEGFFNSSIIALTGMKEYLHGLALRTLEKLEQLTDGQQILERHNLRDLHDRLIYLSEGHPPRTMLEATQLVFTGHCCLHLFGEPVAVGRLDLMLAPFYERDTNNGILDSVTAQEILDCFWIKLGEKVLLNRIFIDDHQQLGNLAMGGSSGPYPKGGATNQWIQQVTIGGKNPDGTWQQSKLMNFAIRSARRLPFNAPVLSLRVGKDMANKEILLHEAAEAIVSGGACPILLNDDKIIPGLEKAGDGIGVGLPNWKNQVQKEDAHNYACDGCYEPQLCGNNWFTLGGLTTLTVLEYTLNQGREMISAGPIHLFGRNQSFRSPSVSEFETFDELLSVFYKHFKWSYAKQIGGLLGDFGRATAVCPAPLLNNFINDCISTGRDYYAGGAKYNVIGPCFTSLANTIDSLWCIKELCFGEYARTTLPELVQCLLVDWGESLMEPFLHPTVLQRMDSSQIVDIKERFQYLRKLALDQPKWGRGNEEIDTFGRDILNNISTITMNILQEPFPDIALQMQALAENFGNEQYPFGGLCMEPGVGTFENYVEQGAPVAASADGRLRSQPLGTDMSPAPLPVDLPLSEAVKNTRDLSKVLQSMSSDDSYGFTNGAPFDCNIDESMTPEELAGYLTEFADGYGSNILTVTTADRETFVNANKDPEPYDLLRVRMGGWTEMFVAMPETHQLVHPRRPYSITKQKCPHQKSNE